MTGAMKVGNDGSVTFTEEDGIDYAATTVQLPGGERVPFLFTIKEFVGKGNTSQFGGDFTMPSYRGSSFLDPKVRNHPDPHRNTSHLVTLFRNYRGTAAPWVQNTWQSGGTVK